MFNDFSRHGVACVAALACLTAFSVSTARAAEIHLSVAADGSGTFTRLQDAIAAVPANSPDRYVLNIKPGTYVADYNPATQTINQFKVTQPNVTFRGLGNRPQDVVLTGNFSAPQTSVNGQTLRNDTYGHATAVVTGANFSAANLTFANTFGQTGGQALALYAKADKMAFNNVRFLGWQDTLRVEYGRQFFKDTYVEGHVDFIYGKATAFFENPTLYVKAGGHVTAPDTINANDYRAKGMVFQGGQITGAAGVSANLGRPWNGSGLAVFDGVKIGPVINTAGWATPNGDYFAEYKSLDLNGNPLSVNGRRAGTYQLTDTQIGAYSLTNWLSGPDNWDAQAAAAAAIAGVPEPSVLGWFGLVAVALRRRVRTNEPGLAGEPARRFRDE